MEKIKKKLVAVNDDMKICEDTLSAINKEVEMTIGSKNRYRDYLLRVFRKKIKLEIQEDIENVEAENKDAKKEDEEEDDEEEEEGEDEDEEGCYY
jgi:hypothetical protein